MLFERMDFEIEVFLYSRSKKVAFLDESISYSMFTVSQVNSCLQYLENMVTTVSKTTRAFVKSRAVTSMKTFFVSRVIFECSPLTIGGKLQIVPLESLITG